MGRPYFMGIDMGTGSLGWAVTDLSYNLCRAHGKDLWGIRLFETANTAEERRMFRTGRRRLDRRNRRIQLLQQIFAPEIARVDPGFFQRLKESRYLPEDKRTIDGTVPELPYALFVDQDYTDKDFHKEYPTIYHLRKRLMDRDEPADIRLVYLALHHLIKHRGHFLFAGIETDKITDFYAAFSEFMRIVEEQELDFSLEVSENNCETIKEILQNPRLTRTKKGTELIRELHASSGCEKALLKLIAGCKVKLSAIFDNPEYETCEKPQISFSENAYEENEAVIESELSDQFVVVAAAKALYDWSILVNILSDSRTISEAKVKVYVKHKKDLRYLKQLVRKHLTKKDYRALFADTNQKNNYCAYIGMAKKNNKKAPLEVKQCTREEFYGYLKKEIYTRLQNEPDAKYLGQELELGTFLPKQVCKDNGVIPYQLQFLELQKILEKAGKYYPFIREQSEKIQQIMTFRIPYYVGPLHVKQEGRNIFSWAVRRSSEAVFPWNFEEVIDVEASAEGFIRRMTNKCTYLPGEDVLPKESLLYNKFMVLNELNNLKINGDKISVKLKQELYENLFKRYRKVTVKKLRDYLVRNGNIKRDTEITGIDGDFKASLRSYHDLKEKFTGSELTEADRESIILNVTLFGDDKTLLKRRIKKLYPCLTEGQQKAVCSLNYKGWGRLSRKFLEEIEAPNPETGEVLSIIRALWETNDNLMQLLGSKYGYREEIEKLSSEWIGGELNYQTVENVNVSPAVKRQIWQTLMVVKELQKVMGGPPRRLFIEMAREKMDTGRTLSRKNMLHELYAKCREEERDWLSELESREEHTFKSDRLFLYYIQKGRCMYCGKQIDIQELWDANIYDIDHIYPQSKVMDDSIRNRVLTCRTCNAEKSDRYPLKEEIRQKMKPFWESLRDGGFIEKEKFKRLVRAEEFTPSELAGFIERQLVETRQSTKAVADILKQAMPDTDIVYVKAKTVSAFRQDFDLIKVRELNDYHHAKDAYLNIVVGNTYFVKFTKDAAWFISSSPDRSYNLKKMFQSDYDVARNGETAWKAGSAGTIKTVRNVMRKNSILFTRRSYEVSGGLFDQQLMKKGKGQVPVKSSEERLRSIEKYGGYNKATGAYFVLVESEGKKGTKKRTMEYVPLYRKAELEADKEKLRAYLENEAGLKNPRILIKKIKTDTLFNVDGFKMHLSGRKGKRLVFKGANPLLIDERRQRVLKKAVKVAEQVKANKNYQVSAYDGVTDEALEDIYHEFLNKLQKRPYRIRLEAQIETLKKGEARFTELPTADKCRMLYEILHLFQCNSTLADLSGIAGPGNAGSLALSNEIGKYDSIAIIHQSPTGIYEQEIDLNKL